MNNYYNHLLSRVLYHIGCEDTWLKLLWFEIEHFRQVSFRVFPMFDWFVLDSSHVFITNEVDLGGVIEPSDDVLTPRMVRILKELPEIMKKSPALILGPVDFLQYWVGPEPIEEAADSLNEQYSFHKNFGF